MPGTVRMSTPMRAASGTMLTPLPPSIVPTFMVGEPITGCDAARREQDRRHARLHVRRAPSVEPVAVGLAGEWVLRPRHRAERDSVDMTGEAERRLFLRSP